MQYQDYSVKDIFGLPLHWEKHFVSICQSYLTLKSMTDGTNHWSLQGETICSNRGAKQSV